MHTFSNPLVREVCRVCAIALISEGKEKKLSENPNGKASKLNEDKEKINKFHKMCAEQIKSNKTNRIRCQ